MKKPSRLMVILIAACLLLTSCSLRQVTAPTVTAAPTRTPFPPTWTPKPTVTLAPTWTPAPSNTPGPTSTVTATLAGGQAAGTVAAASPDAATFVADVTVPDGSVFKPGQSFTKTWQLKNSGTTTWTSDYKVVFVKGERMSAAAENALPKAVAPGETVDISVNMVAPVSEGNFTGLWMLKNASGKMFGVGNAFNEPFYLIIKVSGAGAGATVTPGGTPGAGIKSAVLAVDRGTYSGACPVQLTFTAAVKTEGAGSFTYQLEAGSDTPGFTFTLGGPQTASYSTSGTYSFAYTLNIASSVEGWARLYISSPVTLRSNEVKFSIKCD